jgi:hypothetical protein
MSVSSSEFQVVISSQSKAEIEDSTYSMVKLTKENIHCKKYKIETLK